MLTFYNFLFLFFPSFFSSMINSIDFSAENSIDSTSERSISPTLITQHLSSIIHDTTQKLESMTQELNLSDEELELKRQQRDLMGNKSPENLDEIHELLAHVSPESVALEELVERDKNGYESGNFCDTAHEATTFEDNAQDNVDGSRANDYNSMMLQSVDLRGT